MSMLQNKKSIYNIFKEKTEIERLEHHSPFHMEKALILQRDIFTCSPFVYSLFDKIVYSKPDTFLNLHGLESYLSYQNIDRLVFSNPYRSETIHNIYEYCRKIGFPLLVIERGCLPGTVFFDMGGFLLDSPSYNQEAWDIPSTTEQEAQLNHFMSNYHQGQPALEAQSDKEGSADLVKQLQADNKPVVLITLQMPSDTVTRYFAHKGRDYTSFLKLMNEFVSQYDETYAFIYKPHPRAPELNIENALDASGIHIDHAIELADAVVTFNSGTGVLAFLHNKPVATYGKAFYGGKGLTYQITTNDELDTFLQKLTTSFDYKKRKRFLVHLLSRQLSDVHFNTLRFWKQGVPIAIQYRKARFYDGSTQKVVILNRPIFSHPIVRQMKLGRDIIFAIGRWLNNRLEEIGKSRAI